MEIAIADGDFDPWTQKWRDGAREKYDLSPCREPGSNRCNPYHHP